MPGIADVRLDAAFWIWGCVLAVFLGFAIYPILTLGPYIRAGCRINIHRNRIPPDNKVRQPNPDGDAFVLFLSGVGRVSALTMSRREQGILHRLAGLCRGAVLLDDVFAYSINNLPLVSHRRLSPMWRWALRHKLKKRLHNSALGYLINLRNILHILISADSRYAMVYNRGCAHVITDHLQQYGYDLNQPKPLVIVSYSGAGQIAAGAVQHLWEEYRLPVYVLMLACFFTASGIDRANHVWEFIGTTDQAYRFCLLFSPSRWLIPRLSLWRRLTAAGRTTRIDMGAMKHTGRGGYLDRNSVTPEGVPFIDVTAQAMADVINRISTGSESRKEG